MAIDSENKRRVAGPIPFILTVPPLADGEVSTIDRRHVAGFYTLSISAWLFEFVAKVNCFAWSAINTVFSILAESKTFSRETEEE